MGMWSEHRGEMWPRPLAGAFLISALPHCTRLQCVAHKRHGVENVQPSLLIRSREQLQKPPPIGRYGRGGDTVLMASLLRPILCHGGFAMVKSRS